jgi:hypothetical protein
MAANVSFTIADYSDERSTVSVPIGAITVLGLPGLLTQIGAMRAAVEGLSSGIVQRESWGETSKLTNVLPASQSAQRESKILVVYEDTVTFDLYRAEIPCRDDSAITLITNTDEIDMSAGAALAFKTAFDAMAQQNGHSCRVLSMSVIGRRT